MGAMSGFKDHFSGHAGIYRDARPRTVETLSEASFIRTKKLSLEIFQREVRR